MTHTTQSVEPHKCKQTASRLTTFCFSVCCYSMLHIHTRHDRAHPLVVCTATCQPLQVSLKHAHVSPLPSAAPVVLLFSSAPFPFQTHTRDTTNTYTHTHNTQGPIKSAAKLSAARKAVGFDRTVDGRVLLYSDDGEPFQVKNDMGVPGALLLRCVRGGLSISCHLLLSLCLCLFLSAHTRLHHPPPPACCPLLTHSPLLWLCCVYPRTCTGMRVATCTTSPHLMRTPWCR